MPCNQYIEGMPIMDAQATNISKLGFKYEPELLQKFLAANFPFFFDYEVSPPSRSFTYFRGYKLGCVDIFEHRGTGRHLGYRRYHHLQADRINNFLISLPFVGKITLEQKGVRNAVSPGNLVISTTTKPFTEYTEPIFPQKDFLAYHIIVSGSLLRQRLPLVDGHCQHSIGINHSAGEVLKAMVSLAVQHGESMSELERQYFGRMFIDAIVFAIRDFTDSHSQPGGISDSLVVRIKWMAEAYIENNACNPLLTPQVIADHCNISVRYLYKSFEDSEQTLQTTIQDIRLTRCRDELRNPALISKSIFEIANNWGFRNQSSFSRSYRAKFGKSPRSDRTGE